jgi:hypothetical protein
LLSGQDTTPSDSEETEKNGVSDSEHSGTESIELSSGGEYDHEDFKDDTGKPVSIKKEPVN